MKITIITVTFNAAEALSKTLRNASAFREKFHDYIVVDGGSSDGTREVIDFYIRMGVVTKWVSESDSGIYDAMNKGWRLADDDSHVLYLGAGDMLVSVPDFHGHGYPSDAIFYGNVELEGRGVFRAKADWHLCLGNTLHHQALLVPKWINLDAPFDCKFKTYADFDFNQRLMIRGEEFIFRPDFISFAADGGVSFLLNKSEMVAVCRKNYGRLVAKLSTIFLWMHDLKSRLFGG